MTALMILLSGVALVDASPARRLQVPKNAFLDGRPSTESATQPINLEEGVEDGVNGVESSTGQSRLVVEEMLASPGANKELPAVAAVAIDGELLTNTAVDGDLPADSAVDGELSTSTAVGDKVEASHPQVEMTAALADGSSPLLPLETASQQGLKEMASSEPTAGGVKEMTPADNVQSLVRKTEYKTSIEVTTDESSVPKASQAAIMTSTESLDTAGEAALPLELPDGARVSVQKGDSSASAIQEERQDQVRGAYFIAC